MTRIALAPVRILFAVLAAAAVTLAMWWAAPPANAHDSLVASEPAEGASLDAAPAEATLTFSGEISPVGIAFALHDDAGTTLDLPVVARPDGTTVTQPLPALGPGGYSLDWRVVSSDGHPISGTIAFAVSDAVAAAGGSGEAGATPIASIGGGPANQTGVPSAGPASTSPISELATAEGLPVWAIVLIGIAGIGVILGALVGFRAAARRNDDLRGQAEQRGLDDADE